ncbi:hypothetical protein MUK42_02482 [Musa troglodytarum]|uniref:Uncharacterized protein n=1 Tax=Musa troglodytarum TaxID=320322 RepID=A0A9E7JGZ8_9LILI|nr:hypothetical protein MUK42_02482 [Musa troglodytarum]
MAVGASATPPNPLRILTSSFPAIFKAIFLQPPIMPYLHNPFFPQPNPSPKPFLTGLMPPPLRLTGTSSPPVRTSRLESVAGRSPRSKDRILERLRVSNSGCSIPPQSNRHRRKGGRKGTDYAKFNRRKAHSEKTAIEDNLLHISYIREAKKAEKATISKHFDEHKHSAPQNRKRDPSQPPNMRLRKQVLEKRLGLLSKRIQTFSSHDDDSFKKDKGFMCQNQSSHDRDNGKRVSRCPYPSTTEEMVRLGLRPETTKKSTVRSRVTRKGSLKKRGVILRTSGLKRTPSSQRT